MVSLPQNMPRRDRRRNFAAFDLISSTAARPGRRPPAVMCAAIWTTGAHRPSLWYGLQPKPRRPASFMQPDEVHRLVRYLEELHARGFRLVSWNGTGFDWNLLGHESGDRELCRQLARQHVDMMFHLVCARGHRLSLHRAALGMGLAQQVSPWNAEVLWKQHEFNTVLDRLARDVRVTLELAQRCQEQKLLQWTSTSGRIASLTLPRGWLTVREALHLPLPRVAGLEHPAARRSPTAWLASPSSLAS